MYKVIKKVAPVDDFVRLRKIAKLTPRPKPAVERALPNSLFGVHIIINEQVVGMGRVVGDGAINFEVVDVAVDPEHQGKGLGRVIMESIMEYFDENAPKGAYISLIADVPELYEKFGFKPCRPRSEGMYILRE